MAPGGMPCGGGTLGGGGPPGAPPRPTTSWRIYHYRLNVIDRQCTAVADKFDRTWNAAVWEHTGRGHGVLDGCRAPSCDTG